MEAHKMDSGNGARLLEAGCSTKTILRSTLFLSYPDMDSAIRALIEHEAKCSVCKGGKS